MPSGVDNITVGEIEILTWKEYVLGAFIFSLFLSVAALNSLFLICFYRLRHQAFVKNGTFFICLITTDLINAVLLIPTLFTWFTIPPPHSYDACVLKSLPYLVTNYVSVLSIFAFCLYRIFVIRNITINGAGTGFRGYHAIPLTLAIWFLAIFLVSVPYYMWGNFDKSINECRRAIFNDPSQVLSYFSIIYDVPLISMNVLLLMVMIYPRLSSLNMCSILVDVNAQCLDEIPVYKSNDAIKINTIDQNSKAETDFCVNGKRSSINAQYDEISETYSTIPSSNVESQICKNSRDYSMKKQICALDSTPARLNGIMLEQLSAKDKLIPNQLEDTAEASLNKSDICQPLAANHSYSERGKKAQPKNKRSENSLSENGPCFMIHVESISDLNNMHIQDDVQRSSTYNINPGQNDQSLQRQQNKVRKNRNVSRTFQNRIMPEQVHVDKTLQHIVATPEMVFKGATPLAWQSHRTSGVKPFDKNGLNQRRSDGNASATHKLLNAEIRQCFLTMGILIAVYDVTILPLILDIHLAAQDSTFLMPNALNSLCFLSVFCNPVVYMIRMKRMRAEIKSLVLSCFKRRQSN